MYDGITATKWIRSNPRFVSLPILAMTANAMDRDREMCLAAGMMLISPSPSIPISSTPRRRSSGRPLRAAPRVRFGLIKSPLLPPRTSVAASIPLAASSDLVIPRHRDPPLKRTGGQSQALRIPSPAIRRFPVARSRRPSRRHRRQRCPTAQRFAHSLKRLGANALAEVAAAAEGAIDSGISTRRLLSMRSPFRSRNARLHSRRLLLLNQFPPATSHLQAPTRPLSLSTQEAPRG